MMKRLKILTTLQTIPGKSEARNKEKARKTSLFQGKLRGIALILTYLLLPFLSQAQEINNRTQTDNSSSQIERYLQQAAESNPDVKTAFHRYLASLEDVPQAGALPDPELAFGYFINAVETRVGPQQARLSIGQMFPWFGTLGARKDVKTNQAQAQYRAFQNKRNQLFYEVKSVWYELYILEEKIRILEENIKILESLEDIALQKYETATSDQSDVLQVQIELEDLRISRSELLDNRGVFRQKFMEFLNTDSVYFPDRMNVLAIDLPAEPAELKQQMLAENPTLNQLSSQKEAAEESIRAAKLDGLPKFGIGVDYIFTGQRSDMQLTDNGQDAFMARASIQIPLWRNKYRAQKQQAELNRNAVQEQQSSRQNTLITQFETAMRNFQDAKRKKNLYEEKQIDRTRQAIEILTERYSAAATDFEEVLRLQRRLLNYQQSREEAIGNQNKAVARIEYLIGRYNINPEEINNN